jgi:hypothetical protein
VLRRVVEELQEYADGGGGGWRHLLERFEHFLPLVEQGITQATRRVLEGEHLPATEKLLSLFEEHTQIITRHKAGKPQEKRVVLPKSGKLSEKRKRHEKQRWFKSAFRFRAGIEGRISGLRRAFGLDLCLEHGEDGMERWVGWGIVAHNLRQISRTQVGRQAA